MDDNWMSVEENEKRDRDRRQAVKEAVRVADEIILEASDGSNAETDYLTGEVMKVFVEKVTGRLSSRVYQHDLEKKHEDVRGRTGSVDTGGADPRHDVQG